MGQKTLAVIIVLAVVGGAVWWMMSKDASVSGTQDASQTLTTNNADGGSGSTGTQAPSQDAPQTAQPSGGAAPSAGGTSGAGASANVDVGATVTAPAPVSVSIQSFAFSGGTMTVKKGTKVTWSNKDSAPHTVTSVQGGVPDGVFESGNMNTGASFSYTFDKPGTYTYICKYHPSMKATITVTE